MKIEPLELNGLILIEPTAFHDDRGCFYESYSQKWLPNVEFKQANHVISVKSVLRGLHYQKVTPTCEGQAKLVRATRGIVIDVAVDIRKDSSTLGKWFAVELSEHNRRQLFIPVGFAHGYAVMTDIAEVQYLCSNYYDAETESGIAWDDPQINIDWPLIDPLLSKRDQNNQSFADYLKE